jgi:hypothetical protein
MGLPGNPQKYRVRRNIVIITTEQRIKDFADNIVGRTHEVYQYDLNISNYQTILAASDGVYPEHLLALKDLPQDQAVAQCPIEDLAELAELQQYVRVSFLVRSEIVERTKANGILQVLVTQLQALLPVAADYDAAIDAAVTRRSGA